MMRLVKYSLIFVLMLPLFLLDGQENVKLTKIERDIDEPAERMR
ncbi:hypothetical protein [Mucilaginibacter sp. PPCGB 2223]|nr:hypothetical protein [Mucilaginibacter sp. PPCGB 2223]